MEWIEYVVRRYYLEAGWNEDAYFSNLNASSRAILDFPTPVGLSLHLGKTVSDNFRAAYTLGIVPDLKSGGFLYTNRRLHLPSVISLQDTSESKMGVAWHMWYPPGHTLDNNRKDHFRNGELGAQHTREDGVSSARMGSLPSTTLEDSSKSDSAGTTNIFAGLSRLWDRAVGSLTISSEAGVEKPEVDSSKPILVTIEEMTPRTHSRSPTVKTESSRKSRPPDVRTEKETSTPSRVTGLGEGKALLAVSKESDQESSRPSPKVPEEPSSQPAPSQRIQSSSAVERGDYLLYGRIHQSGGLEAVHSHRLSPNLLLVNTALTAWGKEPKGHFHSQLAYKSSSAAAQLTYDSDASTVGLATLFTLRSPFGGRSQLDAGGELYYVADERSGGVACGLRVRQMYETPQPDPDNGTTNTSLAPASSQSLSASQSPTSPPVANPDSHPPLTDAAPPTTSHLGHPTEPSRIPWESHVTGYPPHVTTTLTLNPMMGHLSFSYTSTVAHGADVSARYDFNAYSYESDLAVGVEWAPLGRGEMVKFGVGKEGIRLTFQKALPRAIVSFGVMAEWSEKGRRDVGVEVQIL
ncbi:hypothetical protein M427DRAFT_26688 [Gonapodya prolifera JEL478]|uniref:Mitochondrial distribution and morphology protein 10 n=1 Tax=Gonapodya prolifera (strain JEL478) TaxID=1344416 RepID=A0A139AZ49_GONPJ|nr:hypothetical protein M427DRAFT_26688 [Gonapodya prolifera JEL478]|eukprot:KXS22011.1 hypothetical protein M427DRAFT_26688 [Gonapodya prolifera JEL478]